MADAPAGTAAFLRAAGFTGADAFLAPLPEDCDRFYKNLTGTKTTSNLRDTDEAACHPRHQRQPPAYAHARRRPSGLRITVHRQATPVLLTAL